MSPSPKPLPKVALVLGGGAAKGFAHVGVIRVLEKEKIPIDMIVATSVGALVGAIYASERDSFQLEWLSYQVTKEDIFDFSILYSKLGPVQGEKLEEFLKTKLKVQKLEDLELPLYPVATDLMTGETVTLVKGSVARAVRASSAIPGVFVPVQFAGRTLIDGGVTNNLPIEIARQKGADVVIAVNLTQDVKNVQIDSVIDIILQSIDIMGKELLTVTRLASHLDTLTPSNRRAVLRHAGAGERSRRCGTPIRQFMQLFTEITQAFQEQLSNEDEFRQTMIDEIKELVAVLEQERARLENM